jgi:hypothetical protein
LRLGPPAPRHPHPDPRVRVASRRVGPGMAIRSFRRPRGASRLAGPATPRRGCARTSWL